MRVSGNFCHRQSEVLCQCPGALLTSTINNNETAAFNWPAQWLSIQTRKAESEKS